MNDVYYEVYEENRWLPNDRKFFKDYESAKKYQRKRQRQFNSLNHGLKACIREVSSKELKRIATKSEIAELLGE